MTTYQILDYLTNIALGYWAAVTVIMLSYMIYRFEPHEPTKRINTQQKTEETRYDSVPDPTRRNAYLPGLLGYTYIPDANKLDDQPI